MEREEIEKIEEIKKIKIRPYREEDCRDIFQLFYDTVHTVNARDYTEEQRNAWANPEADLSAWNRSFLEHETYVAELEGKLAGFGDMDKNGYLDRLYVHKDFQGRGIASALCGRMEGAVKASCYTTCASITARPFFERIGYAVIKEQQVERKGVLLTNFVMKKQNAGS